MSARLPRSIGLGLGPLLDENGEPHEHVPCQDRPYLWDEEASAMDQAFAANACSTCPAIGPCRARRLELGRGAVGVWAGEVLTSQDETAVVPVVYDYELAEWAAAVGVTLHSPEPEEINSCPPAAHAEHDEKTTGSSTERKSGTRSQDGRRSSPRRKPGSLSGGSLSNAAGDRAGSARTSATRSRKSQAS